MRLNIRLVYLFGGVALFCIFLVIIPYPAYLQLTRGLAITLFVLLLLIPKIYFQCENTVCNILLGCSEWILQKIKILGKNEKANSINTAAILLFALFVFMLSLIPSTSYQSIITGILASSLTLALTYSVLFWHEKKRFLSDTFLLLLGGIVDSKLNIGCIEKIKRLSVNWLDPQNKQYENYSTYLERPVERIQNFQKAIDNWMVLVGDYEDRATLAVKSQCYIVQSLNCNPKIKKGMLDALNVADTQLRNDIYSIYLVNNKYTEDVKKSMELSLAGKKIVIACLQKGTLLIGPEKKNQELVQLKNEEIEALVVNFEEQLEVLLATQQAYEKALLELMESFSFSANMEARWDACKKDMADAEM